MPGPGISVVVLPDGQHIELADDGPYPIYSVCDIATGATDNYVDLFSYTKGEDVARNSLGVFPISRPASWRDTNIETKKRMGEDEGMLVTSIRCSMSEAQVATTGTTPDSETFIGREPSVDDRNWARFNRWLVGRFQVSGEKDYEIQEPGWFVAGFGNVNSYGAGLSVGVATNGVASHSAARFVPIPHVIMPTETYRFRLENPDNKTLAWASPTDDSSIITQLRPKITLEGIRRKSVGSARNVPYPLMSV